MSSRRVLLCAFAVTTILGACGEPPRRDEPPPATPAPVAPAVAPITTALAQVRGWGPLTLGMTVGDARAALARVGLAVTDERSAPASDSLTLMFESDGDAGSAWFERGLLGGVALYRTYDDDGDARRRLVSLAQAWGPGSRRVVEGRNAGHVAMHVEWRTDAVVVRVTSRCPGIGQPTRYSEDYRAP